MQALNVRASRKAIARAADGATLYEVREDGPEGEQAQKFDPTVGIILIGLLVVISVVIAASAPSGMQTQ